MYNQRTKHKMGEGEALLVLILPFPMIGGLFHVDVIGTGRVGGWVIPDERDDGSCPYAALSQNFPTI